MQCWKWWTTSCPEECYSKFDRIGIPPKTNIIVTFPTTLGQSERVANHDLKFLLFEILTDGTNPKAQSLNHLSLTAQSLTLEDAHSRLCRLIEVQAQHEQRFSHSTYMSIAKPNPGAV